MLHSIEHSLVNFSLLNASAKKINSGDIAVSEKFFPKLMKTSDDSNAALWRAYPDTKVDFWDENFVDGEYIIAYEMDPDLDPTLIKMLPKVLFLLFKWI